MIYCMSDIHGHYDNYIQMLKEIDFSDNDFLYILGDVIDRGPDPIKVLQDMSLRTNVFPIMGNHEYTFLVILENLLVQITEDNYNTHLDANIMEGIQLWFSDGGQTTFDQFMQLSDEGRELIMEYVSEFAIYETVEANGSDFILTHAGLPEGINRGNFDEFDVQDFLEAKINYDFIYFEDVYLITGHTPTLLIDENCKGRILRKNNHIAIDTGAAFGGLLSCICLDTGEEFYV